MSKRERKKNASLFIDDSITLYSIGIEVKWITIVRPDEKKEKYQTRSRDGRWKKPIDNTVSTYCRLK